jgi:hypothetical protein
MLPPWLRGAYATRRWHSFSLPAYHPAGGRAQDFALITGAVLWFSQQQKKKEKKAYYSGHGLVFVLLLLATDCDCSLLKFVGFV